MTIVKIQVGPTLYVLRKPVGRIGAKHFAILTNSAPTISQADIELINAAKASGKTYDVPMSPVDKERMSEAFTRWAAEVLPNILIPDQNIYKYDEIPGEDQYALFAAMLQQMNIGDDLFRIIP